jgi:hypothetical protein
MTPTPTPITLPSFAPQAAGETLADYGRRAMRYALQLQAPIFAQLDDVALEAAGDAITHALTAKGISDITLACLAGLQRDIRARLAGRLAERAEGFQRLQAWLDAQPADVPPAGGDDAPQGGGGSKVRRPVAPRPPAPPSFAPLPALDMADAF